MMDQEIAKVKLNELNMTSYSAWNGTKFRDLYLRQKPSHAGDTDYVYSAIVEFVPLLAGLILLVIIALEILCLIDTCIRYEIAIINEENRFYSNLNDSSDNDQRHHRQQQPPSSSDEIRIISNEYVSHVNNGLDRTESMIEMQSRSVHSLSCQPHLHIQHQHQQRCEENDYVSIRIGDEDELVETIVRTKKISIEQKI